MADELPTERRALQVFRDKILPTVLAAILISTAGSLIAMRDTVNKHNDALEQVYVAGERVSVRDALINHSTRLEHLATRFDAIDMRTKDMNVYIHMLSELAEDMQRCRRDIGKLEKETR